MDSITEMKEKESLFTPDLYAATYNLAENLAQAEIIIDFQRANKKLMGDQKTLQLIKDAGELQQKVYSGYFSGEDLEENLNHLRELQEQISTNLVIQEQYFARETATTFLREINQEISQLLGVDFAALARRPGAGC